MLQPCRWYRPSRAGAVPPPGHRPRSARPADGRTSAGAQPCRPVQAPGLTAKMPSQAVCICTSSSSFEICVLCMLGVPRTRWQAPGPHSTQCHGPPWFAALGQRFVVKTASQARCTYTSSSSLESCALCTLGVPRIRWQAPGPHSTQHPGGPGLPPGCRGLWSKQPLKQGAPAQAALLLRVIRPTRWACRAPVAPEQFSTQAASLPCNKAPQPLVLGAGVSSQNSRSGNMHLHKKLCF